MKTSVTSWDTDQLEKLSKFINHRIIYDGYNYRWEHKINGKWELHSIKLFDDNKKPYSWIKYWMYKWEIEWMERLFGVNEKDYFIIMKRNLELTKKSYDISNLKLSTKEKVKRIIIINPKIKIKMLCEILNKQPSIIHRHKRNIILD